MSHTQTPRQACGHPALGNRATCGNCGESWCDRCDPAPGPLCHYCHGRGYSLAPWEQPIGIVRALVRLDWRDPYTDAEYVADALAHLAPDVELAEPDPWEREDAWLLDAYFPAGTEPEAVRAALEPWPYDIETDAVPKGAT